MFVWQRDAQRERWELYQLPFTLSACAGGGDAPAPPRPSVLGGVALASPSPLSLVATALPVIPGAVDSRHRPHCEPWPLSYAAVAAVARPTRKHELLANPAALNALQFEAAKLVARHTWYIDRLSEWSDVARIVNNGGAKVHV